MCVAHSSFPDTLISAAFIVFPADAPSSYASHLGLVPFWSSCSLLPSAPPCCRFAADPPLACHHPASADSPAEYFITLSTISASNSAFNLCVFTLWRINLPDAATQHPNAPFSCHTSLTYTIHIDRHLFFIDSSLMSESEAALCVKVNSSSYDSSISSLTHTCTHARASFEPPEKRSSEIPQHQLKNK